MRTTKVLSLSLPPALLRKSELFREALRRYVQERRWPELQRYGAEQARHLGVTGADVERKVREYRAER